MCYKTHCYCYYCVCGVVWCACMCVCVCVYVGGGWLVGACVYACMHACMRVCVCVCAFCCLYFHLKPQSHQVCNLDTTERGGNCGGITERAYDWLKRLWVIARGKSVAARLTVMFKTRAQRFQITGGHRWVVYGCTTSRATSRGDL